MIPAQVRFSQDCQDLLGKSRLSTTFATDPVPEEGDDGAGVISAPKAQGRNRKRETSTRRASSRMSGSFTLKRFRPHKRFERAYRLNEMMREVDKGVKEGGGVASQVITSTCKSHGVEWAAAVCYSLYNQYNEVYGTMADFCTTRSCPKMEAGNHWEFKWADGKVIKTPISIAAPDYCDNLMTWIEDQLDDRTLFPDTTEPIFSSKKLMASAKDQWRRLLRISFHLEYHHREDLEFVQKLELHEHLMRAIYHLMKHYKMYNPDYFKPIASRIPEWKASKTNKAESRTEKTA